MDARYLPTTYLHVPVMMTEDGVEDRQPNKTLCQRQETGSLLQVRGSAAVLDTIYIDRRGILEKGKRTGNVPFPHTRKTRASRFIKVRIFMYGILS